MFTAVTKFPKGQNYEKNTGEFDNITLLAVTQLWPISTWNSLASRALYQAEKLHDCAARVPDQFRVVTNQREFTKALALRREEKNQGQVGLVIGMLGIEGLHALDCKFENIQVLYDAGYRMMGAPSFF
jgi:membrane dipeptidase